MACTIAHWLSCPPEPEVDRSGRPVSDGGLPWAVPSFRALYCPTVVWVLTFSCLLGGLFGPLLPASDSCWESPEAVRSSLGVSCSSQASVKRKARLPIKVRQGLKNAVEQVSDLSASRQLTMPSVVLVFTDAASSNQAWHMMNSRHHGWI